MEMGKPEQKISAIESITLAETSAAVLGSYLVGRREKYIDLESLQIAAAERLLQLGDEHRAFSFVNLAEQTRLSNEAQRIAETNLASARLNQTSAQGMYDAAGNQSNLVNRYLEVAATYMRAADRMDQASSAMMEAARRFPQR